MPPLALAVAGVALLAFVYEAGVIAGQRALLFPRPALARVPVRPVDARQVWLTTHGGPVEAWFLPAFDDVAGPAPLLVFFHGNAELIDFYPAQVDEPRRFGVGVLLVEFPGYGRSGGSPSESSVTEATLAAFDWALTEPRVDARRIVAHGRSLGGGAAAILAANRPVAGLILESTFTSVRTFARRFWVPSLAVRDPFDNLSRVTSFNGPVLVLHGDRDQVIPTEEGRTLAHAAKHAELHLMPGGHNDYERPWNVVRAFLGTCGVLPGQ